MVSVYNAHTAVLFLNLQMNLKHLQTLRLYIKSCTFTLKQSMILDGHTHTQTHVHDCIIQ